MVASYTEHTRSRNMEATFRGNHKTTAFTKCLLHILNIKGLEIWKQLLEEIIKK